MNIDNMSKGAAVEIDVRYNGRTMNFQSEIVHIVKHSILIKSITVDNQTIGFSDKCTINFMYKIDGKLYLWENIQVKLVKYNGEIYHKVDISGDGKVHNRREAFRLYIGEEMPVYVNTASGPTALNVLIKDISETGVSFITKEELDTDRTFRLRLRDDKNVINLPGVIIRKEAIDHLASIIYGCKFSEKNNDLIKYIAKKQGDQLKGKSKLYSTSAKPKNLVVK